MTYRDLDTESVKSYLAERTSLFPKDAVVGARELGRNETDGDGYVNFLFRVWDEKTGRSAIVKQAKPYLKVFGEGRVPLAAERNMIEATIMKLRSAIVPQYVPALYHTDPDNNLYICEDCGDLAIMRYELTRGRAFPLFPQQIGEYMAKCNFYTSEIFHEPETHKELECLFINKHMRALIEDFLFLRESALDEHVLSVVALDPLNKTISDYFHDKRELTIELFKLRDIFMKKSECLQHGDLHTSNILIGRDGLKVFDMEYTNMGPYSGDAGYLGGNLIYSYIAWFYRKTGDERSRGEYRREMLRYLRDMVREYFRVFTECWERDAKPLFRGADEYREYLFDNFIREMCGFMGSQIISRVGGLAELPDFDTLEDPREQYQARILALIIAYSLIMNRDKMRSIDDIIGMTRRLAEQFQADRP